MTNKKKRLISITIIAIVVITIIVSCSIIQKYKSTLFYEYFPDKNVTVAITYKQIPGPAVMGAPQNCTLIIKKNVFFFTKELLNKSFRFNDDGAYLNEKNVEIKWENDGIRVIIRGSEMRDKDFYCPLE